MRIKNHLCFLALAAASLFLPLATGDSGAQAQNIVVLVNDEPITSGDVSQRLRWLARTGGFGDKMKAELDMKNPVKRKALEDRYRQLMMAANPRSEAEAQAHAERIKKQLLEEVKNRVLSEGGGTTRKAAIESLVEDKLKLQAAKKLDIKVSDSEVEQVLAQRAGSPEGKKPDLTEFYGQFEKDGINRKTIQDVIRAQIAWRDVIRRQYGPRIASLLASAPSNDEKTAESDVQFDVRVLRLSVKNGADQRAVSQRIVEADNLKQKFTSCAELVKEAKLVSDATVKSMDKAKMASFPKDVQPLLAKASEGQMTPPVLVGNAVESYAVCKKAVAAAKQKAPAEQKPDARQQEYERFARRYLQELKQTASIDYRGS
jgi:peptidyl-prolyl cis-trans isomerase SurA